MKEKKKRFCPGRWKEVSDAYDKSWGTRVYKCRICGRRVQGYHMTAPRGCGKELRD